MQRVRHDNSSELTIGDSERKSSAAQQREPPTDIPIEGTGPGLVRDVVVQKDQLGFGFTVCGAAVKAGVQEGDRIIKVNGSLVSSMTHQEVVKLIKSGTYVALTLQGPPPSAASMPLEPLSTDPSPNQRTSLGGQVPPPPPPPLPSGLTSTPSQRITGPNHFQKHATEILRKMLEQEEAELQVLLEERLRNPSPSLEERIDSAKRRAHQVRIKIQQDQDGSRPESVANYILAGGLNELTPEHYFCFQGGKAQIIGPEEEDEEDDGYEYIELDGPFQDIEILKSRPAHMTVFMRYVFSQLLDPNPLLFYLSVEAYLGSSPKDARALAPQICSHFLDPDAPLKIKVREEYLTDIGHQGPLSELQQQEQADDGLGSLFGEGDLLQLDGDPAKERQVVDRQPVMQPPVITLSTSILSSPLAAAVLLYLRHSGIKLRDSKVFPGLSLEVWLCLVLQLSGTKKDKEKDGEDKKRNPILKYIGKPRTSQSMRPGNVKNIIQQFESSSEAGKRSISPCFSHSPTISVRLARSESLKAQGEGRRRGAGDVDMEDCGEERESSALRPLQHSASSSASSNSERGLPLALLPDAAALEEDVCEAQHWQETVAPQLLATLSSKEVDRQAVIYELFTTEASHLRTLRVLDQVFYQKMRSVLNSDELACIFPNLQQVYELHGAFDNEKRRESPIVQHIGDVMLTRVLFQEQAAQLCSQQSQALELIKTKQRKDPRFAHVIQECESSPLCRRLQLKDLLVCEMQRLTKYPLLLDNIIKHTDAGSSDLSSLQRAQACCRGILQFVNVVVGETEQRLRLGQYQRRLDAAPQKRRVNPEVRDLDLTTKRMIHEGALTWKSAKTKIQALLLSDCLVLLQRGPDDRLLLRYPSRWMSAGGGSTGDGKTSFSPLVKLDSLLVRSVATDNKALYVISATERQIYELVAGTASEKNTWKDLLEKTISEAGGASPSLTTGQYDYSEYTLPLTLFVLSTTMSDSDCIGTVETLRQLILRDLEEDKWSQGSDDTPTNETATDGSFTDKQRPASLETVLNFSTNEEEEEEEETEAQTETVSENTEQPMVVRKGNTFYLVMPSDQGESATDELADPPTPVATTSPRTNQEVPAREPEGGQSDERVNRKGQPETTPQSHVIKNVDEIFHTIEGLMKKLRHLREVEQAHEKLLQSLRASTASDSDDCSSASVSRTPSLGSADGQCPTCSKKKTL
uniref:Rho guanine nucleotide exchange factor (GEF) 11 n=1 Tax=Neogobius melanostomus TaxID=47308 RepID=A0A8C6SI75_9GOBI